VNRLSASLSGLTTRGRCLLASGIALALFALLVGQRDLLRAAVFLLVLPLAASWLVSRTRYRLACERTLEPARTAAGTTSTVRLRLDNISRLPSGVLLMEDALPYSLGGRPRFVLDKIEPHGVREVSYPVTSDVRGRFTVGPLSVRLTDPFGLCELTRSFATTAELVVTPTVTPLPAVRLGGDWAGGGDARHGRCPAAAPTTPPPASTARRRPAQGALALHGTGRRADGAPRGAAVPEPRHPAARRPVARHRGDGPASSFEWSVSAVASIGVALARAGFALSLLRETGEALAPLGLPLTEGLLLDTLATVSPTRAWSLEGSVEQLRRGGLGGVLIAVLGAVDLQDAEALARLRTGSAVCVAVLVDADSWAPTSARGRAASAQQHEAVDTLLTAAGWRVLPVSSGTSLASRWPLAGGRLATLGGRR
jgi:uncharacterized protein (DUF58 family)